MHARSVARLHATHIRAGTHKTQQYRLPQGNLSVVYDQLGNKYDIPPYCLSEPVNLVKDEGQQAAAASVPTPGENKPDEGQADAKTPAAAPPPVRVPVPNTPARPACHAPPGQAHQDQRERYCLPLREQYCLPDRSTVFSRLCILES
jgi:hypothetical protein